MSPLFSVVIPSYNRASLLPEALGSVASQTCDDYEVIVVDDGSTDNTKEVVESHKLPVRYVYQKNQGAGAARNRGIAEARGEYIAFLDSDDTWLPWKLEVQRGVLQEHSDCVLLGARLGLMSKHGVDDIGRPEDVTVQEFSADDVVVKNPAVTSTVVARKESIQEAGGFRDWMRLSQDVDMWVRLARVGRVYRIGSILALYRDLGREQREVNSGDWRKNLRRMEQIILAYTRDRPCLRRKALGYQYYSFSVEATHAGRHGDALRLLLKSLKELPLALDRRYFPLILQRPRRLRKVLQDICAKGLGPTRLHEPVNWDHENKTPEIS